MGDPPVDVVHPDHQVDDGGQLGGGQGVDRAVARLARGLSDSVMAGRYLLMTGCDDPRDDEGRGGPGGFGPRVTGPASGRVSSVCVGAAPRAGAGLPLGAAVSARLVAYEPGTQRDSSGVHGGHRCAERDAGVRRSWPWPAPGWPRRVPLRSPCTCAGVVTAVVSLDVVRRRSRSCAAGLAAACAQRRLPGRRAARPRRPTARDRSSAPARHSWQCRARAAQRLRELDVRRALGEPELGVVLSTRDAGADGRGLLVQVVECAQLHRVSPPFVVPARWWRVLLVPSGRWVPGRGPACSLRCRCFISVVLLPAGGGAEEIGAVVQFAANRSGLDKQKGRGSRISGSAAWRETAGWWPRQVVLRRDGTQDPWWWRRSRRRRTSEPGHR